MKFDPSNNIVQLCLQGMDFEAKNNPEEAIKTFLQAWNEATNDFEKYLAAYYVTRHQKNASDKLQWAETTLQLALKVNSLAVNGAYPSLYINVAKCYEDIGDIENA